jgi:hypothetical protein
VREIGIGNRENAGERRGEKNEIQVQPVEHNGTEWTIIAT